MLFSLVALTLAVLIIQHPAWTTRATPSFVTDVAFSPDATLLAWTSQGESGEGVVLWDLAQKTRILTLNPRESESEFPVVSTYAPLAFSPDGRAIATGVRSLPGPDHRLILWSSATGKPEKILRGHNDALVALAYSPGGQILASASLDRTVKLWILGSDRPPRSISLANVSVSSVAFLNPGELLTGWGDHRLRIWNVADNQFVSTREGHERAITCVASSPSNQTFASADGGGNLLIWNRASPQPLQTVKLSPHACRALAFSPDGKTLALKFAETSTGVLYNLENPRVIPTFDHASAGIAFSPAQTFLAAAGAGSGRVFLIPLNTLRTHPR